MILLIHDDKMCIFDDTLFFDLSFRFDIYEFFILNIY